MNTARHASAAAAALMALMQARTQSEMKVATAARQQAAQALGLQAAPVQLALHVVEAAEQREIEPRWQVGAQQIGGAAQHTMRRDGGQLNTTGQRHGNTRAIGLPFSSALRPARARRPTASSTFRAHS